MKGVFPPLIRPMLWPSLPAFLDYHPNRYCKTSENSKTFVTQQNDFSEIMNIATGFSVRFLIKFRVTLPIYKT